MDSNSNQLVSYIQSKRAQVLVLGLVLMGVVVGVYLVRTQKIFKSRADDPIYNAFQVSGADCQGNQCSTKSLDVKFKVKDLQQLINK